MFYHNVYFYQTHPGNREEADQLEKGIKTLSTIDTVREFYVGTCVPSEREVVDSTYTFHLMAKFDDKAGHDVYQTHPTHIDFIKACAHLWEKVKVYDSETT